MGIGIVPNDESYPVIYYRESTGIVKIISDKKDYPEHLKNMTYILSRTGIIRAVQVAEITICKSCGEKPHKSDKNCVACKALLMNNNEQDVEAYFNFHSEVEQESWRIEASSQILKKSMDTAELKDDDIFDWEGKRVEMNFSHYKDRIGHLIDF